ncbi:hypothetical protein BGZ75_002918 [Mortierella antarctica]|nr:hypothetical protein BGZ75_002918 [Mortierella antarctica]
MELVSSALAVGYDKNTLLYFSSNRTLSTYNIAPKTWQVGTLLPAAPKYTVYGTQVATDPSTGITYIPSMDDGAGVAASALIMCSYNTIQGSNPNITKTVVQSAPLLYQYFGAVWSTVRKSVLFYGGVSGPQSDVAAMELMEYQPSNSLWATVKTQGATTPGKFQRSCMASVMFGNTEPPYSVFVLDVKTLVWTKGPDPKPGQERYYPACTVVSDYFIIAGGYRNNIFDKSALVYNIKLNQWTDSYEAPHTPTVSTGAGNSSTTETASPAAEQEQLSGEGMPLGAKIGIIAGGSSTLVILLTCGAFLIRRRKMRKSSQTYAIDKELPKLNLESTEEDKNKHNNDSNDSNDNNDNNNEINDNNDGNNNNDNTDDADKAGDNIQLRDILASLDYLTNRFDQQQQHDNQGEEAMFNCEVDELYEDDPDYVPYAGEDMDPYSSSVLDLEYEGGDYNPYEYAYPPPPPMGNNSFPTNAYISPSFPDTTVQQQDHDSNPYFNKSTLEPSENWQQQPAVLNKTLRDAPSPNPDGHLRMQGARNPQNLSSKASSPSLDGLLKPQASRHPQHHSSSIPTVAVQQWQCAQQGQDPQYIPPPPSGPTKPAFAQYPRYDPQDGHGGYHDRLDHRTYYHDLRRNDPQENRDQHNHSVDYSTTYHDKHPNGPQVISSTPNDDEDYLAMYQDPRMNAPQEHGHAFIEKDVSVSNTQHRLNPQDHTRHSTASHLEFYQARPYNNPQDHGHQVDQDDDSVYQEIQRIRAQQEEYMLQRQNLERVRIDNEAKLRTLADRVKYAQPRGQY